MLYKLYFSLCAADPQVSTARHSRPLLLSAMLSPCVEMFPQPVLPLHSLALSLSSQVRVDSLVFFSTPLHRALWLGSLPWNKEFHQTQRFVVFLSKEKNRECTSSPIWTKHFTSFIKFNLPQLTVLLSHFRDKNIESQIHNMLTMTYPSYSKTLISDHVCLTQCIDSSHIWSHSTCSTCPSLYRKALPQLLILLFIQDKLRYYLLMEPRKTLSTSSSH